MASGVATASRTRSRASSSGPGPRPRPSGRSLVWDRVNSVLAPSSGDTPGMTKFSRRVVGRLPIAFRISLPPPQCQGFFMAPGKPASRASHRPGRRRTQPGPSGPRGALKPVPLAGEFYLALGPGRGTMCLLGRVSPCSPHVGTRVGPPPAGPRRFCAHRRRPSCLLDGMGNSNILDDAQAGLGPD